MTRHKEPFHYDGTINRFDPGVHANFTCDDCGTVRSFGFSAAEKYVLILCGKCSGYHWHFFTAMGERLPGGLKEMCEAGKRLLVQ
jgi:hypothetical protein